MSNNIITEINRFLHNNPDGQRLAKEVAKREGLNEKQFEKVTDEVIPAIAKLMKTNPGKVNSVFEYYEKKRNDPKSLLNEQKGFDQGHVKEEGNTILGALFGNKENSRQVAKVTAKRTGVKDSTITHLLPIIATLSTKIISEQLKNKPQFQGKALRGQGKQVTSALTEFLDVDKDGSIVDDLFRMATDIFGGSGKGGGTHH